MLITFLCFSAISPMMAQDIKGKIVDEKDQPLAFTVLIYAYKLPVPHK